MKNFVISLALLAVCLGANGQQKDSLVVMFWNIENFFEPGDSAASPYWTKSRFYRKCDGIAKTILEAADHCGRIPDVVGFAEVGNKKVLQRLIYNTILHKLDYEIVHYDSPDRRGIDCALLYRKSVLNLENSFARHLTDTGGNIIPTRDILVCEFDRLCVLVNHHPSKLGDGASQRREQAMALMSHLGDSLSRTGTGTPQARPTVAVGDFNDTLWGSGEPGTIKYNGTWEKIDGGFGFGGTEFREEIFSSASLTEHDRSHGGLKPRRTFNGPKYLGGISDHFPVVFTVFTGGRPQSGVAHIVQTNLTASLCSAVSFRSMNLSRPAAQDRKDASR